MTTSRPAVRTRGLVALIAMLCALMLATASEADAAKKAEFIRFPGIQFTAQGRAELTAANAMALRQCLRRARGTAERTACQRGRFPARGVKRIQAVRTFATLCHRTGNTYQALSLDSAATNPAAHLGLHGQDLVIFPQLEDTLPAFVRNALLVAGCNAARLLAVAETLLGGIVPEQPTWVNLCGTANDSLRIPTPKAGVAYYVNGVFARPGTVPATGTIVIEARPSGTAFALAGATNGVVRWTVNFSAECVTPRRPVATIVCGPNNDAIAIPGANAATPAETGITYLPGAWVEGARTVTAFPLDGYMFPPDTADSWSYTDANTPCPIAVATVAPGATPVCGANNDLVTIATTEGVTYTVGTWADNDLTVTATPKAGYVIAPGSALAWRVTDGNVACPIVDPPAPPAQVTLRKSVRSISPANKAVKFGLTIRNTGTVTAKNVIITDRIPSGLSVVARPVDGIIRKGVIIWEIGDLQPGQFIFLSATMRLTSNRTVRRCNNAAVVADNAPQVTASVCTRFVRVAGRQRAGTVTG